MSDTTLDYATLQSNLNQSFERMQTLLQSTIADVKEEQKRISGRMDRLEMALTEIKVELAKQSSYIQGVSESRKETRTEMATPMQWLVTLALMLFSALVTYLLNHSNK